MRIRFDESQKQRFAELAGLYEAEFGQEADDAGHPSLSAERNAQGQLTVDVTQDLPAFLSAQGFAFDVVDN